MTDSVEATTRQWGGSIGVIIPNDLVEREGIKPNEKVRLSVTKVRLARDLWGLFPPLKTKESTQSIKDEMRKGWE